VDETPTVEVGPGSEPVFAILIAVLVLAAVGYVVARTVLAHRRGEDAGRAAVGAVRAVGPPVALAVFSLVGLSILAGLAAIVFLIAIIAALAGDGDAFEGLILAFMLGGALLFVALIAAVVWGVRRLARARGEQA
jgi:hypothetical protein